MIVAPQTKEHEKAHYIVTDYAESLVGKASEDEIRKIYLGTADLTGAPQEVIDAYPLHIEFVQYSKELERAFGYID